MIPHTQSATQTDTQSLWNLDRELWNTGNAALAPQVYTAQAVHHEPGGEPVRGCPAIARAIAHLRTAFPDFTIELTQEVIQGDRFVVCWTCYGTHRGDYLGVPPTGRQVELQGATVGRLSDGRIDEEHVYYDRLCFLEQVGALQAAPAASGSGSGLSSGPADNELAATAS